MKKKYKTGIALLIFFMTYLLTAAQVTITTPYPVPAQSLTRVLDSSLLTVQVNFLSACTANTVTINLAPGILYIPGSVTKTAGNAGITITDLGGTANAPSFNINNVSAAGSITFTIKRTAGCGTPASGKDAVTITGSCGTVTENDPNVNSYNILSPALAITGPSPLTGVYAGVTASRNIDITNGGNGCLDTLRYYVVYPAGNIISTNAGSAITVSGINFLPVRASADTLFYKIYGLVVFGGDNLLCNGETVTIQENIKAIDCSPVSIYGTGWGKSSSEICQTATATGVITMANGAAVLNASITETPATSGGCTGSLVTVTYTNSGAGGLAGAMYNIVSNLGYSNSVVGQPIGQNSFNITNALINGNAITFMQTGAGNATPWIAAMSQFSTDPDGAGIGLDDLDGDGQYDDLAPGKTFVISFLRTYISNPACPRPAYDNIPASTLTYTNMCHSLNAVSTQIRGGNNYIFSVAGTNEVVPPVVTDGVFFTVRICAAGTFVPPSPMLTDSVELMLTLPPGVSYAGNATYNGGAAPGYVMQTGQLLTIRQKSIGPTGFCFSFNLVYSCTATGLFTLNMPYSLQYVIDRSCNAVENLACNKNISFNAKCPPPCPAGPANQAPVVRRVDYGWTDGTMSTKVDTSTFSLLSKKTVTVFDTVLISAGAMQVTNDSNLYYYFEVNKAGNADVFKFISGTLFYKAGGTSTVTSCPVQVPDTSASTAGLTKFTFNLTSLLGSACGIPSALNAGDSFWIENKYRITDANNGLLYGSVLTMPGNQGYFYNLDATSAQVYCDTWPAEISVIGLRIDGANDYQHARVVNGCTPITYDLQDYRIYENETTDVFPNEFRPVQYVDSIVVTLPAGVRYNNAVIPQYLTQHFSTPFAGASGAQNIAPPVITGNNITFINPGTWNFSDIARSTMFTNARLSYSLVASCDINAANTDIAIKYYVHNYYYSGLQPQTVSSVVRSNALTVNTAIRPAISVQNNTGNAQGVLPTQTWDVQINSKGSSTAPYVWMSLDNEGRGIVVDSVLLLPANIMVPPINFGMGKIWFKMSTAGIASGDNLQSRIFFHYTNCNADSLRMDAGWDCTGYPNADPVAYACSKSTQYLKVIPQNSQVQIAMGRQPGNGGTISLCNQDSVTVIVNSAQAANLINPSIIIYPPAGITIASVIPVEYPLGSGTWQNIPAVAVTGGGYQISIDQHTGIGANGLPGTVINPSAAARQAMIKIVYSADCSLVSGSELNFFVFGNKPCGTVADGNATGVKSDPVNIAGAAAAGNAALVLTMQGGNSMTCNNSYTLNLSVTELGTTSQAGDTAVYKLPAGINYAGNFSGCAGCSAITQSGSAGTTLVKVALPVNLVSGTNTSFNFDVAAGNNGCGTVQVEAQMERNVGGLSCGASSCTSGKVIMQTATPVSITINKPTITINTLSVSGTPWIAGSNYTVIINYQNTGQAAAPANTYIAELFCGSSSAPFTNHLLEQPLAIGASAADTINLTAIAGDCNVGDLLTAKVQLLTAASISQCLCAASSHTMDFLLPVKLLSFTGKAQNCAIVLNWKTADVSAVTNFDVERGTNENNYVRITSILPGSSDSYNYIDNNILQGNVYYRLKTAGMNGRYQYSNTITVNARCNSANTQWSVYPVLVQHGSIVTVKLNTSNSTTSIISIVITSVTGQRASACDFSAHPGQNLYTLPDNNLAAGTYLVCVYDNKGQRIGAVEKLVYSR